MDEQGIYREEVYDILIALADIKSDVTRVLQYLEEEDEDEPEEEEEDL